MKLNFAYPATGAQKLIEIEDDTKLRFCFDKRMGQEVDMDPLGDEWKGYVCRITGGNDKQGFPMKQGVLSSGRVRLLMGDNHSCYRPRRTGERKRKSVRGCIVDANLSVLALVVVKKGDGEIPGLTDRTVPRRLGPKRANNIRKLFNLSKQDDVRQYVVRRPLKEKEGKKLKTKAPKIQRLITPRRLQRKRHLLAIKKKRAEKSKTEAAEYAKLLMQRAKEEKEKKDEAKRRRSSASKSSDKDTTPKTSVSEGAAAAKKAKVAKTPEKPVKGLKTVAAAKGAVEKVKGAADKSKTTGDKSKAAADKSKGAVDKSKPQKLGDKTKNLPSKELGIKEAPQPAKMKDSGKKPERGVAPPKSEKEPKVTSAGEPKDRVKHQQQQQPPTSSKPTAAQQQKKSEGQPKPAQAKKK